MSEAGRRDWGRVGMPSLGLRSRTKARLPYQATYGGYLEDSSPAPASGSKDAGLCDGSHFITGSAIHSKARRIPRDLQPPHFTGKRPETQRGYVTSLSLPGYHLPKVVLTLDCFQGSCSYRFTLALCKISRLESPCCAAGSLLGLGAFVGDDCRRRAVLKRSQIL